MTTKFDLEQGSNYPYDAPDSFWYDGGEPPVPSSWAHRAARGILANLTDRRGIKRGFENVDEDVRAEIVESISRIILRAYAESGADG